MPWTSPQSLQPDEVCAVTAYLLNLGGVLPADPALWPGKGLSRARAPDVKAVACLTNCVAEARVASLLPDHARNSHGNLADQNRAIGAQHGVDTSRPAGAAAPAAAAAMAAVAPAAAASGDNAAVLSVLGKHSCVACHGLASKLVGPSFQAIAGKHGGRADAQAYLVGKIKSGGSGVWGAVPMPPQTLGDDDAKAIARWQV